MEEVWKDINLSSLNRPSSSSSSSSSAAFIFQDFLARPFTINTTTTPDPPPPPSPSPSPSLSPSPAPPQSLTALSLGSHHRHINRNHHFHHHHPPPPPPPPPPPTSITKLPYPSSPLFVDTLPCSSSLPCFPGITKRFPEPSSSDSAPTLDRRNKRMIKNRESAARSRARKQAYTNELQLKVDHLLEENARLKRQQQQLCEAAATQQKKKSTLYRTFTAPF